MLFLPALGAPTPGWAQDASEDVINPDRPGIADGSYVVGPGRFQIEAGLQQEYRSTSSSRNRRLFVPMLLRFGVNQTVEIRLEGNTYSRMTDAANGLDTLRSEGAAPSSVGIKLHFVDAVGASQPSVGAILRVFPPSGTSEFRTAHTAGDLRLVADWNFAPQWSLNPNLGVAAYEDNARRPYTAALFAATLNYNPTQALNLFVDVGLQSQETRRGRASVIYDVGVAYLVGRNLQLDVSVGWGAAGAAPPRPFLAGGISARF